MNIGEIEFLAERERITINPTFTSESYKFIEGEVGPFSPGVETSVPLWVAIYLKQRQRCHILPPKWLHAETLEHQLKLEKSEASFTEPPSPHYMHVSSLLLKHASDDLVEAERLRTLLKDYWDLRLRKLRDAMEKFLSYPKAVVVKINHLTQHEISTVRAPLCAALDEIRVLKLAAQAFKPADVDDDAHTGTAT